MIPPTPVFLSEEESKRFILFMEHYEFIHTLEKFGIFDLRNGHCKINVDGNGKITAVEATIIRRP